MFDGIATIHECHIDGKEILGRTRKLPHGWMRFFHNEGLLICDDCITKWREKYNEEPPAFDDEELLLI